MPNLFTSAALNDIVQQEINRGNSVRKHAPWPPSVDTIFGLKYRFGQSYRVHGLFYNVINDPHYWYAEIVSAATKEMLIYGFSELNNDA